MSETDDTTPSPDPSHGDSIHDGQDTYEVVLLVEQALTSADAQQVRSLHSEIEDPVVYHVLLPLEDAAARIEASLGTLGAGDVMAAPAMVMSDVDLDAVREECRDRSAKDLAITLKASRPPVGGPPVPSRPSRRSTRSSRRSVRSMPAR